MSQPEEAREKTSKTDDVLRRRPAAPPVGGPGMTGGGTAPVDADARAREIAHADEQAEEAEAGSQEVS